MEGSHQNNFNPYHHYYPYQGMFPPNFLPPPPPPAPAPQSVVPAKREDDDVQFVSSNPVKKRKIGGGRPTMAPPTGKASYSPPVGHPVPAPLAAPAPASVPAPAAPTAVPLSYQPPEPAKPSINTATAATAQPERRCSTGMVDPSPATHMPDLDQMRGCSVPNPVRSDYPDSFWTAPSTGPQSSPPVSPKSFPEHVMSSMMPLNETDGLTSLGTMSEMDGVVGFPPVFPGPVQPADDQAIVSQPPPTSAEGTPVQPDSSTAMQTETAKDTPAVTVPPEPVGSNHPSGHLSGHDAATADAQKGSQQPVTAEVNHTGLLASEGMYPTVTRKISMQGHEKVLVPGLESRPGQSLRASPQVSSRQSISRRLSRRLSRRTSHRSSIRAILAGAPPADLFSAYNPPVTAPPVTAPPVTAPPATAPSVTAPPVTAPPITAPPTTAPPATAPPVTAPSAIAPPVGNSSSHPPSAHVSQTHSISHGTPGQADHCGGRPTTGAKGPCRQCMEARLRQQAANMTAAGGMASTAKAPVPIQAPVPAPAIPQHWPHLLGINPYHNPMAGATYNPMLQQQAMMSGPSSHFTLSQQHAHMPYGLPMQQQQSGAHVLSHTVSPSMQPTQSFVPAQPQPTKAAPPASSAHAAKMPDTQLTTKHIVVDVAETCLKMFPFEEVARRHNQTEQKVRDVFDAVIQVPLLRCVTDKRRAGKLGTTRTKEFKDTRKEIQTQVAATQSKQDAAAQGPYMPSAWEMAQFMGPGDVRMGVFSQFSGPWR